MKSKVLIVGLIHGYGEDLLRSIPWIQFDSELRF